MPIRSLKSPPTAQHFALCRLLEKFVLRKSEVFATPLEDGDGRVGLR